MTRSSVSLLRPLESEQGPGRDREPTTRQDDQRTVAVTVCGTREGQLLHAALETIDRFQVSRCDVTDEEIQGQQASKQ